MFEQYLRLQGIYDFEYEKEWDGIYKRPDYSVVINGKDYIFEVKSLDPRPPVYGFAVSDPYRAIRKKIDEARKQFKPFKEKFPCCLVLWSDDDPCQLIEPAKVGGAMYGNVGRRVYFNTETGGAIGEDVFGKYGKLIRPDEQGPQNTTFSALISLSAYPTGRLWNQLEDVLNHEELKAMGLFQTDDSNMVIPGVTVWENGFAKLPFPRDKFNGPFDHRYVVEDGDFKLQTMGRAWEVIKSMQSPEE